MDIESIWSEYRAGLKAFLLSRVLNPVDVDDLLQEILIKTYNNLETLKSNTSIKPWIYQVANNAIIDFYRRKPKDYELQPDDLWYSKDVKKPLHDLERCVEPFIEALPDKYSKLLTAIDIQGKAQKQYADQHNIKYSTLKSRVHKGRKMLHGLFQECCHFSIDTFGNLMSCEGKTGDCGGC